MEVITSPSKRFAWFGPFFFAVIVGSLVLFAYWRFDTKPPIADIVVRYVGVDHEKPDRGVIEWSGSHRVRACDGTAYSFLIGGITFELPREDLSYNGPVEDYDAKKKRPLRWWTNFTIPRDLAGEEVMLRTRIHWRCNPLQEHIPFVEEVADITVKLPLLPAKETAK